MVRRVVARALGIALVVACKVTTSSGGDDAGTTGVPQTSVDSSDCRVADDALTKVRSAAETAASGDQSCTADEDCMLASEACTCCTSCGGGPIIAKRNVPAFTDTVANVEATDCARFQAAGCRPGVVPCPPPPPGAPTCVNGVCARGTPAAWTSFAFVELTAESGAGEERKVTPDGRLAVTNPTRQATLSAADFAQADAILRSASFRQCEEQQECFCGPMAITRTTELRVGRGQIEDISDASACATTPDGDLGTLYTIVHKY